MTLEGNFEVWKLAQNAKERGLILGIRPEYKPGDWLEVYDEYIDSPGVKVAVIRWSDRGWRCLAVIGAPESSLSALAAVMYRAKSAYYWGNEVAEECPNV